MKMKMLLLAVASVTSSVLSTQGREFHNTRHVSVVIVVVMCDISCRGLQFWCNAGTVISGFRGFAGLPIGHCNHSQ